MVETTNGIFLGKDGKRVRELGEVPIGRLFHAGPGRRDVALVMLGKSDGVQIGAFGEARVLFGEGSWFLGDGEGTKRGGGVESTAPGDVRGRPHGRVVVENRLGSCQLRDEVLDAFGGEACGEPVVASNSGDMDAEDTQAARVGGDHRGAAEALEGRAAVCERVFLVHNTRERGRVGFAIPERDKDRSLREFGGEDARFGGSRADEADQTLVFRPIRDRDQR